LLIDDIEKGNKMKKILVSLMCILLLCSCSNKNNNKNYIEISFDTDIVDNYQIVNVIKYNDNRNFQIYVTNTTNDYSDIENMKIVLYHNQEIVKVIGDISFDKSFIVDNVIVANILLDKPNKNINKVSVYIEK